MSTYRAAIIGATGYTGSELVRILLTHPNVEIMTITSESKAGEPFTAVHPQFTGLIDVPLSSMDDLNPDEVDVIFLALPHGVSMSAAEKLADSGKPIVDLSGDFRLKDPATYTEWYKKEHTFTEGYAKAAYGLPEWYADSIKKSDLIANPGCFPTGAILGITPLAKAGLIENDRIVVDSKTGTTGAGAKAKATTHFPDVHDNFKPYGLKKHRHTIEIEQRVETAANQPITVQFTPHLLPIDRGIISTIYARPTTETSQEELYRLYEDAYAKAPFVRLLQQVPDVKNVRGSNYCDIYVDYDERTNNILVVTAIDNLVKGAAGQAVHNMNIRLGLPETTGLDHVPLKP